MARTPRPDDGDGALLRGGARGFELFYERHERAVLAFFVHRTGRSELAADLAAETFARALAGRERYDPAAGPARAWLFGIARHLLADSLRARRVADETRRRLGMAPVALDDEALARIDELTADDALAALAGLPAEQQQAVRAHVLDERGYDELAAQLACSPSVVRKRVSRGLKTLRDRLEGQR
ncbi:MAG TPA: sigma-70 family RNA polymerase sigma factor [Solirubrobacteraceae bacterium]|nr:sigma-70 family RNA polymerase sigma factor [Solirubrobacteraceae bacterium]